MIKHYNKLIRDNIPEIIKSKGQEPVVRVLSDEEYIIRLKEKLLEEVREYIEDSCIEELCDVYEILDAIKAIEGYTNAEIEAIKKAKADKNGAFNKRLFLESVT